MLEAAAPVLVPEDLRGGCRVKAREVGGLMWMRVQEAGTCRGLRLGAGAGAAAAAMLLAAALWEKEEALAA